jgi:hypothetical protein
METTLQVWQRCGIWGRGGDCLSGHEAHFTRERIPKTPARIFLAGLLAYLEHRKVE